MLKFKLTSPQRRTLLMFLERGHLLVGPKDSFRWCVFDLGREVPNRTTVYSLLEKGYLETTKDGGIRLKPKWRVRLNRQQEKRDAQTRQKGHR